VLNGASARVQVIKHEYHTVLTKSGDYFRYESQKRTSSSIPVVTVSGEGTKYSLCSPVPGDYELRVSIPGSNSYVSRSFYSYGAWGGDNNSFEVNNEGHIDICARQEWLLYRGKRQRLVQNPIRAAGCSSRMETDKVVSYQYVDVDKRTAHVTFP
jgi:hypothetical protein